MKVNEALARMYSEVIVASQKTQGSEKRDKPTVRKEEELPGLTCREVKTLAFK